MKRFLMILLALLPMLWCATSAFAKVDKRQVTFYVNIHCQGCIDKIMSNIAYEKGGEGYTMRPQQEDHCANL